MQIRFLGHAGFEVTSPSGTRLLMDPWLSGEGAFLRSWFPFPENSFLANDVIAGLDPERDTLYVSHHHRDHLDPVFLQRLPSDLRVVIPRFVRRHLRRELESLGFRRVEEIEHGEGRKIGDLYLRLFLDESFVVEDSAILVSSPSASFLNMNDCRANDRLTREDVGAVDVLSMQFSGASWYPSVYDHPPDERARRVEAKNRTKFQNVLEFLMRIGPRFYLPAAGPPCFLDPALRALNRGDPSAFPRDESFLPEVERVGIATSALLPGDIVAIEPEPGVSVHPAAPRDEAVRSDPEGYLDAYADRCGDRHRLERSDEDQLNALEHALREKLAQLPGPVDVEQRICVTLTERPDADPAHVLVDLRALKCAIVDSPPTPPLYRLQVTNETLAAFFGTGAAWEELLLSLRFSASRDPDVHVSAITDFLRLEADDLAQYPPAQANERIVVEHGGEWFEIDRFCPHQRGDLRLAKIDARGILRCPRHGWEFDLNEGGRCLLNDASLSARLVSRPPKR